MIKRVLLTVLTILIILIAFNFELVSYGLLQGIGQIGIILNSRPVYKILADKNVDKKTKEKLELVQEIREFSIEQLGLRNSKNYTTLYDQKGKPVLWVVRACQPYKLENVEWTFPIIGTVSYKGYFRLDKALQLQEKLREQGYDTYVREVSAWSTLGWFKDPILSEMLNDSPGDLANTIIHELTHATIFVRDSITFNENLASFIGDKGAEEYLSFTYPDSVEIIKYEHLKEDRAVFTKHFLLGARYLDSLYKTFSEETPLTEMKTLKEKAIHHIMDNLDTISFYNHEYKTRFNEFLPNNAYFMSYLLYRSGQGRLDSLLQYKYQGDLRLLISDMKKLHPR